MEHVQGRWQMESRCCSGRVTEVDDGSGSSGHGNNGNESVNVEIRSQSAQHKNHMHACTQPPHAAQITSPCVEVKSAFFEMMATARVARRQIFCDGKGAPGIDSKKRQNNTTVMQRTRSDHQWWQAQASGSRRGAQFGCFKVKRPHGVTYIAVSRPFFAK